MRTETNKRRPQTGSRDRNQSKPKNRRSFNSKRKPFTHRDNDRRPRRGARKQPSFNPSQFINKNPIEVKEDVYEPVNAFSDFNFHPRLNEAIAEAGIENPSPIQDQAMPIILEGHDVVGLAQTGTGKTAAFLLPLIHKTVRNRDEQTLILTPTRELALQVEAEFRKFSVGFKQWATTCVGGTNINPQIRSLKRQNHFIIGTPGRVMDLMDRGNLKTNKITNVVLDEADRMLDMGFINDIRKILKDIPSDRQTLFFSATMTKEAEGLVKDFMQDPRNISVKKKDITDSIKQDVVPFDQASKFDYLLTLLSKPDFKRVIIFGAMKHSVEKLAQDLHRNGIKSESIHGNKSHGQRQRSLRAFKSGQASVLVATDVAARGIHVDNVSHVINYDLPATFEDYVHRIGRTGRGIKKGEALTFVPKTK